VRVYCFVLVLLCSSLSCVFADANENATAKNNKATTVVPKVLIVYLSRTNNTKTVAEFIQQAVGGELVAIELQTPYPENRVFASVKNHDKKHRQLRCDFPWFSYLGHANAAAGKKFSGRTSVR
jgi:hypothetical protein